MMGACCCAQWRRDHMRYNFDHRRGTVETAFFQGGRTNMAYNCLDRHIEAGRGGQPCFLWEVGSCSLSRMHHQHLASWISSVAVHPYLQAGADLSADEWAIDGVQCWACRATTSGRSA